MLEATKCNNCGSPLQGDDRHCGNCGALQNQGNSKTYQVGLRPIGSGTPPTYDSLPPTLLPKRKVGKKLSGSKLVLVVGLVLVLLALVSASGLYVFKKLVPGIPPTQSPGPSPTSALTSTPSKPLTITVTDDMQGPGSPGFDQTHRVDWSGSAKHTNDVLFVTTPTINGDSTFAQRGGANIFPSIVWRCSNITAFKVVTYFYHYNGEPEFVFQKSTSPVSSSAPQWMAIPGIQAPATEAPTSSPGWISRTYSLKNLSSVNDIEMAWGTNPQATTNLTPLIGQVVMTCNG